MNMHYQLDFTLNPLTPRSYKYVTSPNNICTSASK